MNHTESSELQNTTVKMKSSLDVCNDRMETKERASKLKIDQQSIQNEQERKTHILINSFGKL